MTRPNLRHCRTWLALLACTVWLFVPSLGATLCFANPGDIAMGIGTGIGCPADDSSPTPDPLDDFDCDDLEIDGVRDLQVHAPAQPDLDTIGVALVRDLLECGFVDSRRLPAARALSPPERYARAGHRIALARAWAVRSTVVLSI
ncbi:MAG: hypothetical protein AB7I19_04920 [Planctomycetota bacterium]